MSLYTKILAVSILLSATAFPLNKITKTTCPKPSELIKNEDSVWATKSNWRSYNPSFINNITIFISAQWQGEHVGKLLCTYSDESRFTFPVVLQAPFLSQTPDGKNWYKPKNSKYFNCLGPNITDCPVNMLEASTPKLESTKELHDFLQSIKPFSPKTD